MIDDYISNLLKSSHKWEPTYEENKRYEKIGLQAFVVEKILSRKFRKSGLYDALVERIKSKVAISFSSGGPIRMILPFGGYKKRIAHNNTEAEWAEFFTLSTVREYMGPIAKLYEPGIVLDYCSDGTAMGWLNNIRTHDIETYNNSFAELVDLIQDQLPKNIRIDYSLAHSFYDDYAAFISKVDKQAWQLMHSWFNRLSLKEKEILIAKASRNYEWIGEENKAEVTSMHKRSTLIESICRHEAYVKLDDEYRYEYLQGGAHIPISTRKGYVGWLQLGSTRSSVVQFWTGIGVLDTADSRIIPRILSKSQYELIRSELSFLPSTVIEKPNFERVPIRSG